VIEKNKISDMNKVKRYIPEKVYDKIQVLEYKNKEYLYIVCDMIYRSSIYKKEDKDYSNQYVDIPRYYFKDLVSRYSEYIEYVIGLGIIECDNTYSKIGGKALGYRFNDDYISKLISVEIEKEILTKKIIKNKNERNNAVNEKLHQYKNHFLSTFKIDYDNAIKHLDDWFYNSTTNLNSLLCGAKLNPEWVKIVNKYNHIFISLSAINDGELYFRKNNTNGRIDTNLTSLKSEYKKFIIGKDLYQVDIINSQPFILYLYLNSLLCGAKLNENDKKELERYGDWTSSGLFYELFEKTYFNKTGKALNRKEIKNMMFCIFYSKNGSYRKEKNIFKTIFPFIMSYIEELKKEKHNEFAIKLQKIESKICIDKICNKLDLENIKYWTIHDAWLISYNDIKKVVNIIHNEFLNNFYRRPELKIEKI
jgi:hypothetical protein